MASSGRELLSPSGAAGQPSPAESPVPTVGIPEQQKERCGWICLLRKGFALTVGRSSVSAQEPGYLWGWLSFLPAGAAGGSCPVWCPRWRNKGQRQLHPSWMPRLTAGERLPVFKISHLPV